MAPGKKVTFLDEPEESKAARVGHRALSTSVYDPTYLIEKETEQDRRSPHDFSRQSPRVRWNLSALIVSFLHDEDPEEVAGVIDGTVMIDWTSESLAHLDEMLLLWIQAKVPGDAIGVFLIFTLYDRDSHIENMLTNMVNEGFTNFDVAWNVTYAHCSEEVASQMIMYDETCIIDPPMGHVEEETEAPQEEEVCTSGNCEDELPAPFEGIGIPFLDMNELTDDKVGGLLSQQTPMERALFEGYPIPKIVLSTIRATKIPSSASGEDLLMSETETSAGGSDCSAHTDAGDEQTWSDILNDPTVFQPARTNERKPEVTRLSNIEAIKVDVLQADDLPGPSTKNGKSIPGAFLYRKVRTRLASTGLRRRGGNDDLRKEFMKGEKE
ncbi:uncharacterized protein N7511_009583 [Penicillium nucicola]|uniref:uncharacterized protein n=1 Tax=Penicillium nucicola TaxID=1850975 RepID=UPI0025451CE3|nr:uncharacterized protein N7511_009583 [Penicillium nucicola]KAJ5747887.1 hypothetical protein N7511_009583 [Penicillium nucicola]